MCQGVNVEGLEAYPYLIYVSLFKNTGHNDVKSTKQ